MRPLTRKAAAKILTSLPDRKSGSGNEISLIALDSGS